MDKMDGASANVLTHPPRHALCARSAEGSTIDTKTDRPSWLQLESVLRPPEVERITSLSWDTITRNHRDKVVDLSPRRVGTKLKDALAIAAGK
jgi:hypothetical protein